MVEHQIVKHDHIPIDSKPRRIQICLEDVNTLVSDLLKADVVRQSQSAWNFLYSGRKEENWRYPNVYLLQSVKRKDDFPNYLVRRNISEIGSFNVCHWSHIICKQRCGRAFHPSNGGE